MTNAGADDSHGGKGIAQDVQKGAASVEVVVVVGAQHQGHEEVDDEADNGDREHRAGKNGRGIREAVHRFADNLHGDQKQGGPVDKGREHLEPMEAVGVPVVRLETCEQYGHIAHCQGEHVEKHMGGIGEESQASRPQASDDFRHEDESGEHEGKHKAAPGRAIARRFLYRANMILRHATPLSCQAGQNTRVVMPQASSAAARG